MDCADPSFTLWDLRKSETERKQLVLLAYRLRAHEAKAFAQPQRCSHGDEYRCSASC